MKYLLSLTLLFISLFSFNSCGDDTVNNSANTPPDFDIYLVKRDIQDNLVSTYTIKSDGTDLKLFNDSMGVSSNSYRNKILLTKGYYNFNEIYIANYNGSFMTKIPLGSYQIIYCNLSPDAEKFYFTTAMWELFILNVDGSGLVPITNQQTNSFNPVKFSPDGKMIAYLEPSSFNHRAVKLFISSATGSYKKLLKDSIQNGDFVDWSSDGKKIIYHYVPLGMNAAKIGVIDTSLNNFLILAEGIFPSCSPISGKICFIKDAGSLKDLFLMDQDGSNIINISNTPNASEYNVKWSKEGMRILYNTYEGSNPPKLWIYDLNTNSNTLLADSVYDAIWQ